MPLQVCFLGDWDPRACRSSLHLFFLCMVRQWGNYLASFKRMLEWYHSGTWRKQEECIFLFMTESKEVALLTCCAFILGAWSLQGQSVVFSLRASALPSTGRNCRIYLHNERTLLINAPQHWQLKRGLFLPHVMNMLSVLEGKGNRNVLAIGSATTSACLGHLLIAAFGNICRRRRSGACDCTTCRMIFTTLTR